MVLPLQIRITDNDVHLEASGVPYGVSMLDELEFAFLVDIDDETVVMSPYEFACHDASCRPPGSGGTGGSKSVGGAAGGDGPVYSKVYAPKGKYVGAAEHASDVAVVTGSGKGGSVRHDGILSEPWLDENGNVTLNAKEDKAAAGALAKFGTSEAEWSANVAKIAKNSMDNDPAQAIRDSKWYSHEHDTWGAPLAAEHGITVDQVMGIASATSTNKTWDGVKSSNKETVGNILKILKEDKPVTITKEQADAYNQFSIDKPSGGGKYGPKSIEAGEFKPSQLSSGTLARVMGSGYNIGGQYFTDGLFKAFSIARGELEPNVAIPSLKQRSFVNNLTHPTKDYSSTNDFWMVRALMGTKPLNLRKGQPPETVRAWEKETGDKPNSFIGTRGSGSSSLFAVATRASKTALKNLAGQDKRFSGMLTHEFQALVWVQMQREYAAAGLEG